MNTSPLKSQTNINEMTTPRSRRLQKLCTRSELKALIEISHTSIRVWDLTIFYQRRKNSTRLPSDEWTFSEQAETSVFTLAELCNMKTVPKGASLQKLLATKPNLDQRFKNTFQFDYQLAQELDHLSNSL